MKKVFLSLSIIGIVLSVKAQDSGLQAGKLYVNGSLGFSMTSQKNERKIGGTTNSSDGPKTTNFNILPSINYLVSDKLSIGLGIGYNYESTEQKAREPTESDLTISTGTFVIAPMVNYFIPLGNDKFGIILGGMVPIAFGTTSNETKSGSTTTTNETSNTGFGVNIMPGVFYFPSPKFMLTASMGNIIGWNMLTRKTDEGTGANTVTNTTTATSIEVFNFDTFGLQFGGSFFF